ncbi:MULTISPECIES: hypothetical protein [unclassified Mycolicibacterium]|uniref:hypothetical protein n=1 Tax=unclassified Mycolicibacterium TaxID=2636767 RepID=UPI0012DFA211|nr:MULTISPECIES: hypothetical protein [unclassified Mycolicibacterium]MUL85391.1 hypothetical protein [Mycolicibacterium sp. CBMA 329]MUL88845.1 hypothetical protein [Mycolicibacterium sp. CBMA 331]MUM01881.1 hypothetical protein [Mycolicibacterium sp. CBMA 334]MUM27608.1 hypothetical protein [Mycolicibacterium sp. CBMA 295]MUM40492.1 hypothetical protein [Mycolicibacterium sp. CBMA 247]
MILGATDASLDVVGGKLWIGRTQPRQHFGHHQFFADPDHEFRIRWTRPVVKIFPSERNQHTSGTIRSVAHSADSADIAQAQYLLAELWRHVEDVSMRLEKAERRMRRSTACDRREVSRLRSALYETHHLIDAIHHRFPETCPHRSPAESTLAER